jgi:carboxyl-terminal processing protease
MKKIFTTLLVMLGALYAVTTLTAQVRELSADQKLRYAEAIIENYYVDDVNSDSIVNEAIIAMLKTLDPHSSYSDPQETRELTQPLEGKFSGIGIQFSIIRDTVCVVQTTAGGPSERAGILPGDRILYVNDTLFTRPKMVNTDVTKTLRGPKGSTVKLKIKRDNDMIDFKLIRQDIPIYSVDASYMADATTGFISISRFAEGTPEELEKAIKKLKAQGMKNLILDLEDNGGGYLGAAHRLASMFLNEGDMVVYTEGSKAQTAVLTADAHEDYGIDRVVVMVNQYSASAAEITAGALQDHDRAVIVGRRTFGKGLVQRPFPFPDGSMIRLTTSRYHTPSGRCIQKHYEKGQGEEYQLDMLNRYNHGELWSADSIKFDENQRYTTLRTHRTVYGGGGIMPDVFVPVDTTYYTTYYRDLVAKGSISGMVSDLIQKDRKTLLKNYPDDDAFNANFTVGDDLIAKLVARGEEDGVKENAEQLERSLPMFKAIIKGLMMRDLYENGYYSRAVNPLNPVFNEALRLINDPARYNSLLTPSE